MRLRRKRERGEVEVRSPGYENAAAAIERAKEAAEEAIRQRDEMHLKVLQRRRDFLAPDIEAAMQSRRNT